jgi:hypothetical protein
MHVCIFLDNAGDRRLNGALTARDAAHAIRKLAEKTIAEQVVVVVAGTGLITDSIKEGRGGAYHFRMKPLQREDLEIMLRSRFYEEGMPWCNSEGKIPAKDPRKEALAIAEAIEAQPALMAVARNAEMAFGLVDAVLKTIRLSETRYEGPHLAEFWSAQLGAGAAGLVRDAIRGYVGASSMLASLNPAQRRRVAIWTLWELHSTKKWVSPQDWPRRWFRYPEFPGLNEGEREVAMAMVEINTVQYRGGFRKLRWETHVATIVPANVLVLFYLLGVPTSVLTGWATSDVGTALYAVLQWVVKKVQAHHDEILRPFQKSCLPEYDFGSEDASQKAFELKLAEKGEAAVNEYRSGVEKREESLELSLRVVPLRLLPPWHVQGESGCIRVPRASRDSILIFGGGGGGDLPDVVAPYLFLRAVRGAKGNEVVDLEAELRKCCLLTDCEDVRLLRGLLAGWSGTLPDDGGSPEGDVVIDPTGRVAGRNSLQLPKLAAVPKHDRLRFVLTTPFDAIRVALPTGRVLKLEEKMVDSNSRQLRDAECAVSLRWLGADAAAAWTAFLQDRVLPLVQVEFVFVKSGISPLAATSTRDTCQR